MKDLSTLSRCQTENLRNAFPCQRCSMPRPLCKIRVYYALCEREFSMERMTALVHYFCWIVRTTRQLSALSLAMLACQRCGCRAIHVVTVHEVRTSVLWLLSFLFCIILRMLHLRSLKCEKITVRMCNIWWWAHWRRPVSHVSQMKLLPRTCGSVLTSGSALINRPLHKIDDAICLLCFWQDHDS